MVGSAHPTFSSNRSTSPSMCMEREPLTRSQSPGSSNSLSTRAPSASRRMGKMRAAAQPAFPGAGGHLQAEVAVDHQVIQP